MKSPDRPVKSPDRRAPICCLVFFREALSAAWSKLKSSERKPFEAQAMIDRCRKEIQDLRGAKLKETPKWLVIGAWRIILFSGESL